MGRERREGCAKRWALCVCCVGLLLVMALVGSAEADEPGESGQLEALTKRLVKLEEQSRARAKEHKSEIAALQRQMALQKEESEGRLNEIQNLIGEGLAPSGGGGRLVTGLGDIETYIGVTASVMGSFGADDVSFNPVTNTQEGDHTDVTYSADIEFSASVGEKGKLLLYLETGEGNGLASDLQVLTGVNYDALGDDADVQVSEFWYEHKFMDDKLTMNIGKMWLKRWFDTNAVANNETSQFMADMFDNNIAMEPGWLTYSPGVRLSYAPNDWLELQAAYIDGNADFENVGNDAFVIGEIDFKPVFGNRQGNYRFYAWHADLKRPEYRQSLFRKLWDDFDRDEKNEGFGLSFDQEVSDSVTLFLRAGMQDEDVAPLAWSWSTGFQSNMGWLGDRENDTFGLAVGQGMISKAYEKSFAPNRVQQFLWGLTSGAGWPWRSLRNPGQPDENEFHAEMYYNYYVNEHMALTADMQYFSNPGGFSKADDIFVVGLRAQLDF